MVVQVPHASIREALYLNQINFMMVLEAFYIAEVQLLCDLLFVSGVTSLK